MRINEWLRCSNKSRKPFYFSSIKKKTFFKKKKNELVYFSHFLLSRINETWTWYTYHELLFDGNHSYGTSFTLVRRKIWIIIIPPKRRRANLTAWDFSQLARTINQCPRAYTTYTTAAVCTNKRSLRRLHSHRVFELDRLVYPSVFTPEEAANSLK